MFYGTFYALSRTGKSTETQNRQVIVRGCGDDGEEELSGNRVSSGVMSCPAVIVASYCGFPE